MEWSELRSLLSELAEIEDGILGSLRVTRNGETLTFSAERLQNAATTEDLLTIRGFLARTARERMSHWLVIVGQHSAKIYRDYRSVAEPHGFVEYDPHGFGWMLADRFDESDQFDWPERESFYEAIALTLRGTGPILILGKGTRSKRAMDQLVAHMNRSHDDVSVRLIGCVAAAMQSMTEDELLAQASAYFHSRA